MKKPKDFESFKKTDFSFLRYQYDLVSLGTLDLSHDESLGWVRDPNIFLGVKLFGLSRQQLWKEEEGASKNTFRYGELRMGIT